MTTTETISQRRAVLPLATFVVALLMTATSGLAEVWWSAIDERFIGVADDAGWDERLLLPHQMGLWLAINGALLLSVVLSVLSFVALVRSRRPETPAG